MSRALESRSLEARLRSGRAAGRSLLVPYVTAGISADWLDHARGFAAAGADAIEIGLPFSDPMLDGAAIQQASQRALERGTTPHSAIAQAAELDLDVPLIAMTYSNVVIRHGQAAFCARLRQAGFSALIVVDTPHDEAGPLIRAATEHQIELVLLVAPSTPDRHLARIARQSSGFVYATTVMGTTGERSDVPAEAVPQEAVRLVADVRRHTTLPVLLGFGISTPAVAARAAAAADGVIVASALARRMLAGAGPAETAQAVHDLRAALDTLVVS